MRGELQAAVDDINQSIASDPANAWAYRNKGIYYLKINDAQAAVRLLKQATEMDPFVDDVYAYLAEAYWLAGNIVEACKAYKESRDRKESINVSSIQCK